jgi:hypothetical protein
MTRYTACSKAVSATRLTSNLDDAQILWTPVKLWLCCNNFLHGLVCQVSDLRVVKICRTLITAVSQPGWGKRYAAFAKRSANSGVHSTHPKGVNRPCVLRRWEDIVAHAQLL